MSESLTPFTVLGGFLGSGKTTMLNRLLSEPDSRRYAVLVNDFGKINIDESLIRQHDGQTMTLSNGCICCSLADGFINTLLQLMQRRQDFDHIIVESSGVSEPQRIMDIARLDPELRADAIIVLVDVCHLPQQLKDPAIAPMLHAQIQSAHLLVLNKVDLVDENFLQSVRETVRRINSNAPMLHCEFAHVPVEALTDASIQPDLSDNPEIAAESTVPSKQATAYPSIPINLPTVSLQLEAVSSSEFDRFQKSLPSTVIRGKGLITFVDKPGLWIWHKVASQQTLTEATEADSRAPGWKLPDSKASQLVLIGTAEPLLDAQFAHWCVDPGQSSTS